MGGERIRVLAGQYFDNETGLQYSYHRYYDPKTGKYLTPDPIGSAKGDVNLYSYVWNNPIISIENFGLASFDWKKNLIMFLSFPLIFIVAIAVISLLANIFSIYKFYKFKGYKYLFMLLFFSAVFLCSSYLTVKIYKAANILSEPIKMQNDSNVKIECSKINLRKVGIRCQS